MKICHITSVHKLDDVRIFLKECLTLSHKYEVVLLGNDISEKRSENKKIKIVNINYKTKNRLERLLKLNYLLYKRAIQIDAEIYHLHDPELLIMCILLKRKGKKVIFDSHEETSKQILAKTYIPYYLRKIISKIYLSLEIYTAKKIDAIVTATPTIKEHFQKYNKNVESVNNYPILNEFNNIDTSFKNKENQIVYIGGLSRERGIMTMINLANRLPQINLVLCGNYISKEEEKMAMKSIQNNNVINLGFLGRKEVIEVLEKSKLGLVLLERNPRYAKSLPIKMFEYMAANIPVVVSKFELWQDIIDESGAGIYVDENNIDEIVKEVEKLISSDNKLKSMGERGRKFVFEKYNWENEEKKLFAVYKKLEG